VSSRIDSKHLSRKLGAKDRTRDKRRAATAPVTRSLDRFQRQVWQRAHAVVGTGFFHGVSELAKMHPLANPERHQVEVIRHVPYIDDGLPEHTLDIYRPKIHTAPWPVVFYVHGGGFQLLSKNTHWVMGLGYARFGYMVINISYRLAPKHPYPAAIEDVCRAYVWAVEHAAEYGGDLSRLAVAGESAGANLVAALTVAACYARHEPWARRVFDTGVVPSATIPACGMLQVSNAERFGNRRRLPFWVEDVLTGVEDGYLHGVDTSRPGALDLADPLVVFERGEPPDRRIPAFFVPVGTKDPLLDDTRRLKAALDRMGVPCEAGYYEGEVHAFHAMVWRKPAKRCWRDILAFLDRHLRDSRSRERAELSRSGSAAAGE